MIFIIVVLVTFFVILASAVGIVFYNMTNENKKLKAKNTELENKLDYLAKQPSIIGLSYKTDNETIKKIFKNLSAVLLELQNVSCERMRSKLLESKKTYENAIASNTSCVDAKKHINTMIDEIVYALINDPGFKMPSTNATVVEKELKDMFTTMITAMCKDDKFDATQMGQFMMDVFNTICHM